MHTIIDRPYVTNFKFLAYLSLFENCILNIHNLVPVYQYAKKCNVKICSEIICVGDVSVKLRAFGSKRKWRIVLISNDERFWDLRLLISRQIKIGRQIPRFHSLDWRCCYTEASNILCVTKTIAGSETRKLTICKRFAFVRTQFVYWSVW